MATIQINKPQVQEVGQTVGTRARANEFEGIGQAVGGLARMANNWKKTSDREAVAAAKSEAEKSSGAFQVGQMEEIREAAGVDIASQLSEEDNAFLQGEASAKEKYSLAKKQGVGDAYLRMRLNDRMISALRDRPDLTDEINQVYRSYSSNLTDIESQLDDYRKPMKDARDKEIGRRIERMQMFGLADATEFANDSPQSVDAAYAASGLAEWDSLFANADMHSSLAEKNQKIDDYNLRKERENFQKEHPGLVHGMVLGYANNIFAAAAKGASPEELQFMADDQRGLVVNTLAQKLGYSNPADVERDFAPVLAMFNSAAKIDPSSAEATRLQNLNTIMVQGALNKMYVDNPDFVSLTAFSNAAGSLLSGNQEFLAQFDGYAATMAERVSTGRFNYDHNHVKKLVTSNPVNGSRTVTRLLTNEGATPEAQAGIDHAAAVMLAPQEAYDAETTSTMFTANLPAMSNPAMIDRWNTVGATEEGKAQLTRLKGRTNGFISSQVTTLFDSYPNAAKDYLLRGEDGLFLTKAGTPENVVKFIGQINMSIKSRAILDGSTDYATAYDTLFSGAK